MERARAATHRMRSSCELLQESHVGIVQQANVGNVVAKHRDPRGAHPERPARIPLALDSGRFENRWMNHPRAEYLHPAGALAAGTAGSVTQLALDIHLGGGLGERKEARPEPRLRLAEQPVGEIGEGRLQIDEGDSFVYGEPFDLCEHRRVRRVEEVPPVAVPRAENSYRRFIRPHRPDLDGRGMRPQHHAVAEVQRVVCIEGWMVRRKVERGEVVPLGFRFRPQRDREAQSAEDSLDLLDYLGDWVSRTPPLVTRGHGQIQLRLGDSGLLKLLAPLFEAALEHGLDRVYQRATFAQITSRERGKLLEELGKPARFATEEGCPGFFERR